MTAITSPAVGFDSRILRKPATTARASTRRARTAPTTSPITFRHWCEQALPPAVPG
ncbi:hypothetical protein [Streptomyces hygroscopicus]|uniref:hypothetical protein n=1 Tax=Streptomyces hygroscopicus TaxID=1912 RepID=UPI001FCBBAB7|nr:hypothetical protein [Streptomyces hygroscopicus]BDH12600.1 hypothetical protein HOK021_37790 [Streptomyces hygroscopicus]